MIEGLARWNMQRSKESTEGGTAKVPRSFDIMLKHRYQALSSTVHNEVALPSFSTPPTYTGELIGMSYLRSQNGDFPGEIELDKEIDEAFGDFNMAEEEDNEEMLETDETVAMPDDSSDSGNEVIILLGSSSPEFPH